MNASLVHIHSQSGVRGDGERVFDASPIVVPIPCDLKDPSSHRRATDRSNGIESVALISISREALRMQGATWGVGDRVVYKQLRLNAVEQTADIVSIRDLAGEKIELILGERIDDAQMGGGA